MEENFLNEIKRILELDDPTYRKMRAVRMVVNKFEGWEGDAANALVNHSLLPKTSGLIR